MSFWRWVAGVAGVRLGAWAGLPASCRPLRGQKSANSPAQAPSLWARGRAPAGQQAGPLPQPKPVGARVCWPCGFFSAGVAGHRPRAGVQFGCRQRRCSLPVRRSSRGDQPTHSARIGCGWGSWPIFGRAADGMRPAAPAAPDPAQAIARQPMPSQAAAALEFPRRNPKWGRLRCALALSGCRARAQAFFLPFKHSP